MSIGVLMNRSENINELATALSKAQGEFVPAKKSGTNYFGQPHATLEDIWEVIRRPLSKNGLSVTHWPGILEGKPILDIFLSHTSGQWMQGSVLLFFKEPTSQSLKSATTLQQRSSLESMLGVPSEDDDGEASMNRKNEENGKPVTPGKFVVTFGKKYKDKTLESIDPIELDGYRTFITESLKKEGKQATGEVQLFLNACKEYLGD